MKIKKIIAAKKMMMEKEHGRPISVSYRKAMGLEGDKKNVPDYIIEGHKKRLAPNPGFDEGEES